jgi:dCMP deaminase
VILQRIYVTLFPCNECAKLLIQAGIQEVVFHEVGVALVA